MSSLLATFSVFLSNIVLNWNLLIDNREIFRGCEIWLSSACFVADRWRNAMQPQILVFVSPFRFPSADPPRESFYFITLSIPHHWSRYVCAKIYERQGHENIHSRKRSGSRKLTCTANKNANQLRIYCPEVWWESMESRLLFPILRPHETLLREFMFVN